MSLGRNGRGSNESLALTGGERVLQPCRDRGGPAGLIIEPPGD
jgi:hypothetical protein